jgi:hypothetical protein
MKTILVIAAIIALCVGGYFLINPDNGKWSLFYYNNCSGCSGDGEIVLDAYDSSEKCLEAGENAKDKDLDARAYLEEPYGTPPAWECGLNCRTKDTVNGKPTYICEKTVD